MGLPSSVRYFRRRAHIFSTAGIVYLVLKLTSFTNRILGRKDDEEDDAWASANTRAANIILRTAMARRGLWIKCCQYVAARQDALPPEYGQVLSKSLDDCPPSPVKSVIRTVNEQLANTQVGKTFFKQHGKQITVDDVFDGFDPASPIASASIAQVHVATLRENGRKVVLKVQHPGVKPMLLQDLEDLKTLLRWIAGAEPKYDMRPVLDAWIEMVPKETDFLNECHNLLAVKNTLESNDIPHLRASAYVPEPIIHLTSEKLFVMEYIDGCKINDSATLDKHDVQCARLVEDVSRSFGNQLFLAKVFNGDPHMGNFLVHKLNQGGQPVLLDFGICVKVEESMMLGFAKLILAAVDNDSFSLVQALGDIGLELNRADPVASLDIVKYLFRTTAPTDESREQQAAMKKRLEDREDEIAKNERDHQVKDVFTRKSEEKGDQKKKRESRSPIDSFPGDLVFFFRSLGMLRGMATSLNVRHSYLDSIRPFAEYALNNSCPAKDRIKESVYRPLTSKGMRGVAAEKALTRIFNKLYATNMMIGMQVAVYKNGKLALNMAAGRMGRYNQRPVRTDSVFNSFSCTKGLTAILYASIQDEFNVSNSDFVTKYWPKYAKGGKGETKIEHILSHSAGLQSALPKDMPMTRLRDDWKGIIKHLEGSKPEIPPGSKSEYHALTFGWLVAGLIEKISKKTYQQHLLALAAKLEIENECYCGTMSEEMVADVPESRIASLSSSILSDLEKGPVADIMKKAFGGKKKPRKGKKNKEQMPASPKPDQSQDVGMWKAKQRGF